MELYVTEISKYVIDLFMLIYVIEAFMAFRYKTEKKRNSFAQNSAVKKCSLPELISGENS